MPRNGRARKSNQAVKHRSLYSSLPHHSPLCSVLEAKFKGVNWKGLAQVETGRGKERSPSTPHSIQRKPAFDTPLEVLTDIIVLSLS